MRSTRLGLILFFIYLACYSIFVLVNALSPRSMEEIAFLDLNWAVLSGMGLIILAVILSLIYGLFTRGESQ